MSSVSRWCERVSKWVCVWVSEFTCFLPHCITTSLRHCFTTSLASVPTANVWRGEVRWQRQSPLHHTLTTTHHYSTLLLHSTHTHTTPLQHFFPMKWGRTHTYTHIHTYISINTYTTVIALQRYSFTHADDSFSIVRPRRQWQWQGRWSPRDLSSSSSSSSSSRNDSWSFWHWLLS